MKILFISGGDYKYGAPKAMVELLFMLRERYEIEPVVLTKKHNPINVLCDERGIENYSFWYRDIMAGSAYSATLLNLMKHMVKYILYFYGGFTQRKIGKALGNMADIDLIHTNLNRLDIGSYLSRKYGIPQVCHLRELRSGHCRIVTYGIHTIRQLSEANVRFFAISKLTQKNWIMAGLDEKKIQVIYDGIDVQPYIQSEFKDCTELTVACVGRIEENKGQMQIVEALHYLPQEVLEHTKVYMAGEAYPEYKKKLLRLLRKYNLHGRITLCGYCSDVPALLRQCNVGITCSKGEAFGRVTVEYMAAGLAVVASDTGANCEILENGKYGLLYHYGNGKELAGKLSYLYYHKEEMKQLLLQSRKRAFMFTKERNAEQIYKAYCEILEKCGK